MTNERFQHLIADKGAELWRDMPWRDNTQPYYVLVSELMLQQTQVSRVIPKFNAFIEVFPNIQTLADAPLSRVLQQWQGLGYNRRAKFLHDAAKMIVADFDGRFPDTERDLIKLPGVGKNTAGALRAYAFNQPSIFVETNVRTVYIHHLFDDDVLVNDAEIIALLEQTIDRQNPRRFYQALMDYGSDLKASGIKNNSRSRHYTKQPPLKGSLREIRGQIIRVLTRDPTSHSELSKELICDERFEPALAGLQRDGLVEKTGELWHLTNR